MKKLLLFILSPLLLFNCNQLAQSAATPNKTWVYAELNIGKIGEPTEKYLYGRITKNDIKRFKSKSRSSTAFELTDARYINDAGNISDYSKDNEVGTFYFRFKDILYFEILKEDPLKVQETDTIATAI